MNNKRLLKILVFIIVIFIGLLGFYKFMTYDRNYTWAKEYKKELQIVAEKSGLKVQQTGEIDVTEIKRSTEKTVKIKIQKFFDKVNIMTYGHEYGEITKLTADNKEGFVNCKGWCLDDHLIGLEIEYSDIDDSIMNNFKYNLEKQFDNYKIKWTQL